MIKVLDRETIDKIAAGEVVERPMSVVKELTENAIDSGASSVSVEIKDGGISLIRVTDNGAGIPGDDVRTAFLRHATGKINDADDLEHIMTLGFRGEALSSISAVARVEMITKPASQLTGIRYVIEGSEEKSFSEVGAPDGTTVIVRDIFYNTPARKKFLKSPSTEAAHISELVEMIALSHPDIAFTFTVNGNVRLRTSGNGSLKDIIYAIYGKSITDSLIEIHNEQDGFRVDGYIAKPEVSRSNRNFEIYFINGRYIKSSIINAAVEDGYAGRLMQHQFPFVLLLMSSQPERIDVNVHPTKMDVRFDRGVWVHDFITDSIASTLRERDMIPKAEVFRSTPDSPEKKVTYRPEPFETKRVAESVRAGLSPAPESTKNASRIAPESIEKIPADTPTFTEQVTLDIPVTRRDDIRIIGEVFDTYWIFETGNKMYILDQHAAHEKIYYERFLKQYHEAGITSQQVNPPVIITLSEVEADVLKNNLEVFESLGYEIEEFGGKEYAIRSMPDVLPSVPKAELLKEMISDMNRLSAGDPISIIEKTASMACKAAVKGGDRLSAAQAGMLIAELMTLDNPYNCPHGRPTMIEYSKTDLEKRFKRII